MQKRHIMKIAIVSYNIVDMDGLSQGLKSEFNTELESIVLFGQDIKRRPYLYQDIKAYAPDLLITFELAGFELCTLTDSLSYNLLDCKQLHWINKKGNVNEHYLEEILSIAMFFATGKEEIFEYLSENYAHIPRLYMVNESNGNVNIARALRRVAIETKIISE